DGSASRSGERRRERPRERERPLGDRSPRRRLDSPASGCSLVPAVWTADTLRGGSDSSASKSGSSNSGTGAGCAWFGRRPPRRPPRWRCGIPQAAKHLSASLFSYDPFALRAEYDRATSKGMLLRGSTFLQAPPGEGCGENHPKIIVDPNWCHRRIILLHSQSL